MPLSPTLLGHKTKPQKFSYDFKNVIVYALGIGARSKDELNFVYESADPFRVFPTFSVVPAFPALIDVLADADIDLSRVLHGEHGFILHRTLPEAATLSTVSEITGVYDKGKAGLITVKSATSDEKGNLLFESQDSIFVRGAGGFGGERGPEPENVEPDLSKTPEFEVVYQTTEDQAALYRLSGDLNPIHISPEMAAFAKFDRPILHGLCSYGFVGRAFLHAVCGSDPARFGGLSARFSGIVYPGDTLTIRGWKLDDTRYSILAYTQASDKPVISQCVATVRSV